MEGHVQLGIFEVFPMKQIYASVHFVPGSKGTIKCIDFAVSWVVVSRSVAVIYSCPGAKWQVIPVIYQGQMVPVRVKIVVCIVALLHDIGCIPVKGLMVLFRNTQADIVGIQLSLSLVLVNKIVAVAVLGHGKRLYDYAL